ncbi:YktB family protein [Paenibacillus sp. YYML68]|uniref:YktB family protein n=1 Tax=Paenibacillus sp. YYML68 TaxID=2909250 RepID=UPI0024930A10|nr:DUF1054 domain-containing protein [Paenibacillus sp. YYML68]
MTFTGFTAEDFDVFTIDGLEPRMEALIERVRPKLHELGSALSPALTTLCGEEMFTHVAKHARRTVHAPNDTWVAWANNKKGYKAHPHFQVGLWSTHLFVQFALIYESPNKSIFAANLEQQWDEVASSLPPHYVWSLDHMKPEGIPHTELQGETLEQLLLKLKTIKKSEALCGIHLNRHDPIVQDGPRLLAEIERVFETVMPLYRLAQQN